MKLNEWQSLVAEDDHRFKVVIAGRRSGKTYLSIRQICYHARLPDQEIYYITASYRMAKTIVWKQLKNRLLDLRWAKKINESELQIQLKNGSTISLKGAEDPSRLRGVRLNYCVIDEAAFVSQELFSEVVRPALADDLGACLFISTPLGKSNWTYDLFNNQETQPEQWKSWQIRTIDAGTVAPEEIEAARADMSEKQFRQEFEATFETFEGLVAWNFKRELHCVDSEAWDTSQILVGCDFNVSPCTAAILVKSTTGIVQIDEVVLHNSNTEELAQEINTRYPRSKVFAFPDPAGSARKTSAGGATDHTILERAGFIVKAPRKHDPIRDRINNINWLLQSSDGVSRLQIAKTCKYTIECLEKYSFKPGSQIPDKGEFDHMFDALTYCTNYVMPLKKQIDKPQPQRWGAKLR